MIKITNNFLISLGFFLFSLWTPVHSEPIYCKYADKLTDAHTNFMVARGFQPRVLGGGFMYDVNQITIGFTSDMAPSVEQARILFITGVSQLLRLVNHDTQIQPYLHNRPFGLRNLDYTLKFKRNCNSQSIVYVHCSPEGEIYYNVYDPIPGGRHYRVVHHESFDEALRIVQESTALTFTPIDQQ